MGQPSTEELLERVRQVLREHCAVQKTALPESRLAEDLGLDSVGLLTLAVELENSYRIRLGETPDQAPRTVDDVLQLLLQRLREGETV
ncbi:MAG: acyl carrier protein [Leptospirales bacterium]|nr:acyl carrier protein [Leptospirales bacterium]